MPKPRKPSSAQARAQGHGNNPNNFSCGDNNRREIHILFSSHDTSESTSRLVVNNSAMRMNGAQSSDTNLIGTVENNAANEIFKPNNEQVASGSNPPELIGVSKKYKKYCKDLGDAIKAGIAKINPDRPYLSVTLDDRCFVLNKGITNEAIDEFVAEFVSFNFKRAAGFKSGEEENWANVIKKLASIAIESKKKPIWVNKDGTEEPFTVTGRDRLCVNPVGPHLKNNFVKSPEEAAKANEDARFCIALMMLPKAAVFVLGKHYIIREDRKDTDVKEFFRKFVKFVKTDKDNEAEKCNVLNLLKTFSDEVEESVVEEQCDNQVTMDDTFLQGEEFGIYINNIHLEKTQEVPVNECTGQGGNEPSEPKEAVSIDVDQYEEVDGFNPHDIKCKCVIS